MIGRKPTATTIGFGALLLLASFTTSCVPTSEGAKRPNVLWIVWDTARSDHLSLYGHERETTTFLERWAEGARVFDNCVSTSGYTLPSHASMFTGLMPSEHCAHNGHKRLDDSFVTIAELLQGAGYRTYLYSANPHISRAANFAQGFDRAQHPWSAEYRDLALALIRSKLPEYDRSSELPGRLADAARGTGGLAPWNIKAAGEIARDATLDWLAASDQEKPFFVFLNYMEAHRPYIPPRKFREKLMEPEEVDRSYEVDRSWERMWEYIFGLVDYDEEEIELTRATYDAALLELDGMLETLLGSLEEAGRLENTIVVLTSDHGEHLGEQHMLDHQYSVYEPLLRVPLIVHYPEALAPGRDDRPVMNFDLFPTLLELTGVAPPADLALSAVSLLDPPAERPRMAEEPHFSRLGMRLVSQRHPDWDPTPWQRQLRAWIDGEEKLIWGSDGRNELFDLAEDPLETRNLLPAEAERAAALEEDLTRYHASLEQCEFLDDQNQPISPEQRQLLKSLGYAE